MPISRFRNYVAKGGLHFLKWKELDHRLTVSFAHKRADNIIIHDRDLKQIAMEIAEDLHLDDFKAKIKIINNLNI